MPKAARLHDPIAHTGALAGLVGGMVAGAVIGAAIALTVATGGVAAPVLIGATLVGAAVGAWVVEFIGSLSFMSPVTGEITTGSHNVFINSRAAARAMQDVGMCSKHSPPPALIVQGSGNVFINGLHAARLDDHLKCGAFIKDGSPNVYIGGGQFTDEGGFGADVPGWLHWTVGAMGVAGALLLGGAAVIPALVGGLALGMVGGEVLGWVGEHFGDELSETVGGLPSDWKKIGTFLGQGLGGYAGYKAGTGKAGAQAGEFLSAKWNGFQNRMKGLSEEGPKTLRSGENYRAVAEEAYEQYSTELPNAKKVLSDLAGDMADIGGRAKSPGSAANRLQRAVDNGWAKEINTKEDAINNLWDAVGTRAVIKEPTPENMSLFVDRLSNAIAEGKIDVVEVNSLAGKDGIPYLTETHLAQIREAGASVGKDIKVVPKEYDTGYTVGTVFVKYPSGVRGEMQIIGPKVMEVANPEHIP